MNIEGKLEKYLNEEKEEKLDENKSELKQINPSAETVNVQVRDYDGNKTKFMGMNDKESINSLINFFKERLKNL